MKASVEPYLKKCRIKRDLRDPPEVDVFACPCIDGMNRVPENCPKSPEIPHRVKGSLMPLYRVGHPGPRTSWAIYRAPMSKSS